MNSVIPCPNPIGCNWPACSLNCQWRPGKENHGVLLDAALEQVKSLPPMTKEQIEAQAKSWVITNNLMLPNPEMTREEAEAIYDRIER